MESETKCIFDKLTLWNHLNLTEENGKNDSLFFFNITFPKALHNMI